MTTQQTDIDEIIRRILETERREGRATTQVAAAPVPETTAMTRLEAAAERIARRGALGTQPRVLTTRAQLASQQEKQRKAQEKQEEEFQEDEAMLALIVSDPSLAGPLGLEGFLAQRPPEFSQRPNVRRLLAQAQAAPQPVSRAPRGPREFQELIGQIQRAPSPPELVPPPIAKAMGESSTVTDAACS